ncbi:cytoplasm protein [Phaffia rhodozyma]|uniref:Cytoplasm protein n=1 Tax=Phaffia rhodozyma TaxID=264483 RepID=A0A0F7SJK3_PHARH|nr:cytoplasm protein [Phaffia rhodozyma]
MTSVSRSHKAGSTISRSQSLIKKNTALADFKPSDLLIERFTAWKRITKMLIAYFEGIADIENNTAKELTKLGAVIQVPFQAGNQFLGEDGIQDVFYSVRDKTRVIADSHASLAKTVEGSIVQHLQKLRAEIKAHIKNVQNDTGRLAATVAKERELSTKHISDLARAITMLKNTPMNVVPKDDPYAQNTVVLKQLQKQQNSAHFEEGIVRSIQSAWSTFDEWQGRMSVSVQETWKHLGVAMAQMEPDREWIAFAARSDHLLDPETPLRNPDHIDYPGKDDPSVAPVHVGLLERKKRFTKTYKESYYVLTPAGYLHEYSSSDSYSHTTPVFSLFLPACTLGPPSTSNASRSHKFHIEGKRSAAPTQSAGGHIPFKIPGQNETAYTFRSRSHDEMMEWWNDLRMLVARYLVASEQMERSGPVAAAVRSVGYRSEEEESEDGGSSVEDEEEYEENHSVHETSAQVVETDQHPVSLHQAPQYAQAESSHTHTHAETSLAQATSGLEIGANGYPIEKKPQPDVHNSTALGQPITSTGDYRTETITTTHHPVSTGEESSIIQPAGTTTTTTTTSGDHIDNTDAVSQKGLLGRFAEGMGLSR